MEQKQGIIEGTPGRLNRLIKVVENNEAAFPPDAEVNKASNKLVTSAAVAKAIADANASGHGVYYLDAVKYNITGNSGTIPSEQWAEIQPILDKTATDSTSPGMSNPGNILVVNLGFFSTTATYVWKNETQYDIHTTIPSSKSDGLEIASMTVSFVLGSSVTYSVSSFPTSPLRLVTTGKGAKYLGDDGTYHDFSLEVKISKGKLMFRTRTQTFGDRIVFFRRKRRRVNHTKNTTPDYSEADWMAYGFDFPAKHYKDYSVDASSVTPGQWTEFPFDWKTLAVACTDKGVKGCRFSGNVYPKFCSGSSNTGGKDMKVLECGLKCVRVNPDYVSGTKENGKIPDKFSIEGELVRFNLRLTHDSSTPDEFTVTPVMA